MKFCPTWKFKIFLSHFQKVQDHEFLMCGWGDMIQSWQSVLETSNGHNFWTKAPIWVVLFAFWSSWHVVSKTSITWHEFHLHDHVLIHEVFWRKFHKINLDDYMHKISIPKLAWALFKWFWISIVHCSRMHERHKVKIQFCEYTLQLANLTWLWLKLVFRMINKWFIRLILTALAKKHTFSDLNLKNQPNFSLKNISKFFTQKPFLLLDSWWGSILEQVWTWI